MAPAIPCKRMERQQSSLRQLSAESKIGNDKEFKTMYGCMVESHESTRQRAESLQSQSHEDRIAGEGFTSMNHYHLVHKFIPMPQGMKIPDAESAVDKEWKKLETSHASNLEKVKGSKEVILDAQRDEKESPLCFTDGLKNAELEPKFQQYLGRVVLRGCIVKDDSGANVVFIEQGSSAS